MMNEFELSSPQILFLATNIPWKALNVIEEVNGESLGSIAPSECLEAFKWNTGGPCHKLHKRTVTEQQSTHTSLFRTTLQFFTCICPLIKLYNIALPHVTMVTILACKSRNLCSLSNISTACQNH